METLFNTIDPILLLSSIGGLILFALAYLVHQSFSNGKARSEVKKRLTSEPTRSHVDQDPLEPAKDKKDNNKAKITKKVAEKANDFYANSDPGSVKKLRMMLIQAGIMNPGAVGYFIAARFAAAAVFALLGGILILTLYSAEGSAFKFSLVVSLVAIGYFLPNFYLSRKTAATELANRQGFPDILDLMVVSAEAGLTRAIVKSGV